ncbi:zinc ribbon domain-containing protein [Schaalia naturae]|uniref:Zinc ribbon domain-containing protein n=1 Tax=Schaalia naturae TaxID=635203 RepID=A0ABW2SKW5_9ACTO
MYCSCGAKLMIERPRDKAGDRYEYFTCSGRRKKKGCTRSAVLAERIEERVENTYGTNGLTPAQAEQVKGVLHEVFDQLEASSSDERALLEAQKNRLEDERLKLIQARYAEAIPLDLLKIEQDRIQTSLITITNRLDSLATTYTSARKGLDQITDILTNLGALYAKCDPAERRLLNRALFTKIIVDDDENLTYEPVLAVAGIHAHLDAILPDQITPETKLPRQEAGQVSNTASLVDLRREFENPCPHLKTLSLRRSRRYYDEDQRSSEPTVSDSRGRVVRSLGMAQTLLRPEQVDDLVAQYREGATLVELASVFGVNRRTVATHLTRREVTIRRGRFDPSRIHEAADLYLSGLTLVEVGLKVGTGPQAVRQALASHGVVIRPGGRRGSRITATAAVSG